MDWSVLFCVSCHNYDISSDRTRASKQNAYLRAPRHLHNISRQAGLQGVECERTLRRGGGGEAEKKKFGRGGGGFVLIESGVLSGFPNPSTFNT